MLVPFQGTMTPHTRIPLNQGICGAASSTGKTIVVNDVAADARYLACSLETKSEIVIPVFVHGKVAGELGVDCLSPPLAATTASLRARHHSTRKIPREILITKLSMICLARGLGHRRRYRQRKCALPAQ